MEIRRSSGILMPIFSLPERYGIGTLGKAAYDFVDFLVKAGQKYWQLLPIGSLSYGNSPYQSFSTYAGNPYFVDLDILIEDGLLTQDEVDGKDWGSDPERVDYGKLYENRFTVLRLAADRGLVRDADAFAQFVEEKKVWIKDYALFMAVKRHFDMKPWSEWPEMDIRLHNPEACERYEKLLKDDVELFEYIQFLFFKQWKSLKEYAVEKGVSIIGDIPIYVAMDSSDVWAEPGWFQLDEENIPIDISGVPPDSFSADGQLWGNPLYRWDKMKEDGFSWWVRRVAGAFDLYDILRIDHFRGIESYWAIPYGDTTAMNGRWVKGPGMDLVGVLLEQFADKSFIAEDLGYLTEGVRQLLEDSGLPGMKILEFAFDSREASNYLPHTYTNNCVCYTGTHDNITLVGWLDDASAEDVRYAMDYLGVKDREDLAWSFIRAGMASVSNLFIVQMQDYLELGKESRVNAPGILEGNWMWRMKSDAISDSLISRIASMTRLYDRD